MSDSGVVAVSFVTVHFNSITLFLPMYLPFCQLTPSRAAARSVSSSRCLDPWLHAGSQAEHTASTARVLRFSRGATVYALHRGRRVFTLKVLLSTHLLSSVTLSTGNIQPAIPCSHPAHGSQFIGTLNQKIW